MASPEPVRQRRVCRILVAAAGYGKTTALRRWFPPETSRWYRDVVTPTGPLVTDAANAGHRLVVFDDLPRLPAEEVHGLAEAVAAGPDGMTVIVCSRLPPAEPPARWLGRGLWTELGPADLALAPADVAAVLTGEYDITEAGVADLVHAATGGWPALVHLAAETLRRDGLPPGPLAPAIARPGGPLATYLADEVLSALPAEVTRLLRQVGELSPVSAGLCRALGHRQAEQTLDLLRRTGLLIGTGPPTRTGPPTPSGPPNGTGAPSGSRSTAALPGWPATAEALVPLVAEVARQGHRRPSARRIATTAAAAAAWYDADGPAVAAAHAFRRAGDDANCARVLDEHGDRMIAAGQAESVATLIAALPDGLRTRRLRLLLGDALRTLGDLDAAARTYDAVAGTEPEWDAGLAWRVGRIRYQRGDAHAALAAFERGHARTAPDVDAALLLVWTAHAHLLAGRTTTAAESARRALSLAVEAGGDGALATAHLAVALCLSVAGDTAGGEEHYALALPIAERGGDLLLLARIHTNRTFNLIRTARLAEALAAAQRSARYAAAAGSPSLRAIATCNEADALALLGRYDEAVDRFEAALTHYQRQGSRRFAGALLGLGELHRRRGWREQARAAYEEAIRVTEETGNLHVLVPALAGLALVLLDDDPKAAADHAERATGLAAAELVVPALLAQGWIAAHGGDPAGATALATEAARVSRGQHDLAGLADALELRAATAGQPERVREALREAHAIWHEAGAVVEAARILVLLGSLPAADTEARLDGLLAAERLTAASALVERIASRPPDADLTGPGGRAVAITALGRFEVHIGGRPVPASQWQSRKARDLLRILVARRGRPVPRGELCELLWPEDAPERTGHRLSVLLSIIRGVLDPAKTFATDHFLVADQSSIALEIARVRVDVEEFLAQVAHGRRLVERGMPVEAGAILLAADRRYAADAFEDEPYADWSGPLREEVRAAYLSMLRMLAQTRRVTSGPPAAVAYLLRLLERDPYDEPAHRALVRTLVGAGQHGEARRAFRRYAEAMRAIGVRPPDQMILTAGHPGPAAAGPGARPGSVKRARLGAVDGH